MDQNTWLKVAIRSAIRSLGIGDLSIKFDLDRRLIVAIYLHGGSIHRKEIAFEEIESLLTEGTIQARTQTQAAELKAAGG